MMADTMVVWSSFLASPEAPKTALSPLELDGYLTGIVVTPREAPIMPSEWLPRLWGDDEPIFDDDEQIKIVLGAVMKHHNALVTAIDRSLNRLETGGVADYRPLFLSDNQTAKHESVRTWVRGFWKAMALAPETWSALVEDERTQILIHPFVGFFDLDDHGPYETLANFDDLLDEDAALIPRMILVLRKLAHIRHANGYAPQRHRRSKVGRNDPCPCGSGQKYKRCCGRA
jgi:uncharacterized protein